MKDIPPRNPHLAGQPWLWEYPPKNWKVKADVWFAMEGLKLLPDLIVYIFGPESPNDAFDLIQERANVR